MARETGHRDSEIGGSKNGNNNALLESLVNGYGNGKCNECIKYVGYIYLDICRLVGISSSS